VSGIVAHVLQAHDDSDRHHWLQCIQAALLSCNPVPSDTTVTGSNSCTSHTTTTLGRSSSDCLDRSSMSKASSVPDGDTSIDSMTSLQSVFSNDSWAKSVQPKLRRGRKVSASDGGGGLETLDEDTDSGIIV